MLHFIVGTDKEKVRHVLAKTTEEATKSDVRVVRLTDISSRADVEVTFQGGGLFGEKKLVVFDGVWAVLDLKDAVRAHLADLKASTDVFYIVEEKLEAAERKVIEKYAETSEKYELAKKEKESFNIFSLANALKKGNKKDLWVGYQRALKSHAPEAIHGILFWGAKDMLLKSHSSSESARARRCVAVLAELPHRARREGMDLGYALEVFLLSKI